MNILFRADSSSTIGTGHIMRDLVLASRYKDTNIIFAVQNLEGNINYKIEEAGYKIEVLQSNSIEEVNRLIKKYNIDLIVIDHYGIDYTYEKELKIKTPKLKILSFDDTYEKHYCDILINHNISGDKNKYKNLVPKECELRCGSEYTLLRDEFVEEKNRVKKLKIKNESYKIFLAMGGSDHSNINMKILKVLEKFSDIEVTLVTTSANSNLKKLKHYIQNKSWIKLYLNSNRIASLMNLSSFAIVSPSVTLNEIVYMEIPFIAIKTADNQKDMYDYLCDNKANVLEQFSNNELEKHIKSMLKRLNNG